MGKLSKMLWMTTKLGVCGGSVYWTVNQGVWGEPHESIALYNRIYNMVPGLRSVTEEYLLAYLPKKSDANINFRHYWNTAILYSFDFLADSPAKAVVLKDYVVDKISTFTSSEESTSIEEKSKQT